MEFSGAKRDDFKLQSRLEPVNEGGSALLNMVSASHPEPPVRRTRFTRAQTTALFTQSARNVSHMAQQTSRLKRICKQICALAFCVNSLMESCWCHCCRILVNFERLREDSVAFGAVPV